MQVPIFYLFKKIRRCKFGRKNKILIVEPSKEPYTKTVYDIE